MSYEEWLAIVNSGPLGEADDRMIELLKTRYAVVMEFKEEYYSVRALHGLVRDVYNWMRRNIKDEWCVEGCLRELIAFKNPDDAFAFKLRWG